MVLTHYCMVPQLLQPAHMFRQFTIQDAKQLVLHFLSWGTLNGYGYSQAYVVILQAFMEMWSNIILYYLCDYYVFLIDQSRLIEKRLYALYINKMR